MEIAMKNKEAIEALERHLGEMERKANTLVEVINDLRHEDGLPPRGPFGGGGTTATNSGASVTKIKPDTFYNKKLQTAVREYLEMRMVAAGGATSPASPREIYTAITEGGYQFDAKDEHVALVSLRALLRKRSAFFHKLPNGTYGLTAWYGDIKKPKNATATAEAEEGDEAEENETATAAKAAAAS
jgi:hypothetical protein